MKTRVVFPSIWDDDRFSALSKTARYAVNFLINNDKLTLTRYSQISDKYATYCTGLTPKEWTDVKGELELSGLFFFYKGWVYHNHDFAYVDYSGRDRVVAGKEKELRSIPLEITEYFKGLVTGYKGVVNPPQTTHKPINQKPINQKEGIREKEENAKKFLELYNLHQQTNFSSTHSVKDNLDYWLSQGYTLDKIETAIKNIPLDEFWKDKMTPETLLRRRNTKGEAVDYIGRFLNSKTNSSTLTQLTKAQIKTYWETPEDKREKLLVYLNEHGFDTRPLRQS